MKNVMVLLINKFIRRYSTGKALKIFCSEMGMAYIKLAQILSMWNIDKVFTEQDRVDIQQICDECKPVSLSEVKSLLIEYYGGKPKFLRKFYTTPIGSASVSQVHKAELVTGEIVVLKIKRKDVATTIQKDMEILRWVAKWFAPLFGITNQTGLQAAINMYYEWIGCEIDFENEVQNILKYQKFANSVNGKIPGYCDIVMPRVYIEYCTPNVIVMEYVPYKTLSQRPRLNDKFIRHGFDSYIMLSFWALLHRNPVVFHGDPHLGNIYVDDNNNLGFLDMGLLFELSPQEAEDVIELFMLVFFQNAEALYLKLQKYITGSADTCKRFQKAVEQFCSDIPNKPISNYFVDLMIECLTYEIVPPSYLFKMAKAFVYLGGTEQMYASDICGYELLLPQVMQYLCQSLISSIKNSREQALRTCDAVLDADWDNAVLYGCRVLSKIKSSSNTVNSIVSLMKQRFRDYQEGTA